MVVPHTTDVPRSYPLTDRMLRVVMWGTAAVAILVVTGVGALVFRVRAAERALATTWASGDWQVDSLRLRLDSLNGQLGGIRSHESRIRTSVGVTPTDSPSFWSRVLRGVRASQTSRGPERLAQLRDSLKREIRGTSAVTDSLESHARSVSLRVQRMADSVTGTATTSVGAGELQRTKGRVAPATRP